MKPSRDVLITGYGVVSPVGIGWPEFQTAIREGRSGVGTIQGFATDGLPSRIAGEVRGFDPKEYVTPRKSLKVMCRDIQLAFAAAKLALTHGGVAAGSFDPDRFGVVFAADMIYCDVAEVANPFRACLENGKFSFSRWGDAMREFYPLWMLEYLPNMAACHVAIALDARGPNNTIVAGEVSSLLAITEAARIIERGWADVMLTGGSSARVHPSVIALRPDDQYSHRNDAPAVACRPFDKDREGQVPGEGAAVILLESREHAEARGARPMASLVGHGSSHEPCAKRGQTTGRALRQAMEMALREARPAVEAVGHVNAHGLGTRMHDPIEAQTIRNLLGDAPVTAPKSYLGNLEAASGAVELGFSLMALESGDVPPTLNYETPDPECPVHVVHGEPLAADHRSALLVNQSLWGQSAAIVIRGAG